jgi:hypothetical protein
MDGHRLTHLVTGGLSLLALSLGGAGGARGIEFQDGRLQIHGYGEVQLRGIANDFNLSDDLDLTQWYNVLDVEVEWAVAPDGFGPFDLVSLFGRVEGRYDCVWRDACGVFPSVDTFGNRAEHLPKRYASTRRSGFTGATFTGDTRRIHLIGGEFGKPSFDLEQLGFAAKDVPVGDRHQPTYLWHFPGVDTLFGVPGTDGIVGTGDDPAFSTFERFVRPGSEYRFASRRIAGPIDGNDRQFLGPWLPKNRIIPLAALADRPNPFNPLDLNPIAGPPPGSFGSTELPYRPAPNVEFDADTLASPTADPAEPRGLFVPNEAVARLMRKDEFDDFDQNFSQSDLQWNHGASQEDERELKELYVDLELLDSRLWLRFGKQSIVWGKTELFRTTDQFNPQDIALASLSGLEESRIALWSGRFVYSFFTVGPLEDVRLEGALNFDEFEPTDLGRCGEPYTPNPVCSKTTGLFAHGLAGFGLAGEVRPPDPWDSVQGLEGGARLEFRWDRFSFALSDFYGYDDLPFLDPLFYYSRNVDPRTGRPRRGNSRSGCDPDGLVDGDTTGCLDPDDDALFHHHANQQRFAVICSASVGFNDLDRSVCAQSIFNSSALADPANPISPHVSTALTAMLAAQDAGAFLFRELTGGTLAPLVTLDVDPATDGPPAPPTGDFLYDVWTPAGVAPALTDQQEALLGCGRFWQTDCDVEGIDLLNAELNLLQQSWPGFPGTFGDWNTTDASVAQPGTEGFVGGAVCTRYERGGGSVLPGCRGPDDPGYDPAVDGDPAGLLHPFTAQQFQNELGALSWNLLAVLVGLSAPSSGPPAIDQFDVDDPLRLDGCSFARAQLCTNVQALYAVAHTTRRTLRAGGNQRFGRVDFDWHVGGSGVLRYEKRNVLGFSMDAAEDVTKSNWSFETTWIDDIPYDDRDELDGLRTVDTFNLTVSMDRPTFVNFLNANRTFFINSQWFFQYVDGYRGSFPSDGPFNTLMTLTVDTGYFQDRLLPVMTFVYDFPSNSGALLPEIQYRFTENFSATFGMAFFWGRFQAKTAPLATVGDPPFRTGRHSQKEFVENGLSAVRDRDEIFLRVRYTF